MSVVGSIHLIFILRKNPKNEGGGESQLCHPKLSHPWPRRSRCNAHNATFQPPFLSLKPEFRTEFKGNGNLCCTVFTIYSHFPPFQMFLRFITI